jgi:hypothetical protein
VAKTRSYLACSAKGEALNYNPGVMRCRWDGSETGPACCALPKPCWPSQLCRCRDYRRGVRRFFSRNGFAIDLEEALAGRGPGVV